MLMYADDRQTRQSHTEVTDLSRILLFYIVEWGVTNSTAPNMKDQESD